MQKRTGATVLLILILLSLGGCMMTDNKSTNPEEYSSLLEQKMQEREEDAAELQRLAGDYIANKYPDDQFILNLSSDPSSTRMEFYYGSERFPDERIMVLAFVEKGKIHFRDEYAGYTIGDEFAEKLAPQLKEIFGEDYRVRAFVSPVHLLEQYEEPLSYDEYTTQYKNTDIFIQLYIKEVSDEQRIILEEQYTQLLLQQNIWSSAYIKYIHDDKWVEFSQLSLAQISIDRTEQVSYIKNSYGVWINTQDDGQYVVSSTFYE